jgi:hypothetical protein
LLSKQIDEWNPPPVEQAQHDTDGRLRKLLEMAATEIEGGYRAIAESAGVGGNPDSGRVLLLAWVNGRNNRVGERYYPKLAGENGKAILAFLEGRYPIEVSQIRREQVNAERSKLLEGLPRSRNRSSRELFANALTEMGLSGIDPSEIRAGWELQQVYKPEDGLGVEDLEYFGPLLEEEDREELARAVQENLNVKELLQALQSRRREGP